MAGRQLTEEDMNRGLSKDQVLEPLGCCSKGHQIG